MKKTVTVAGMEFGTGLPKVCVPLTSGCELGLLKEARQAAALPADLYEWRADWYRGDAPQALALLRRELGEKPLLCTLRTQSEGGQARLSPAEYEERLAALVELGGFQLLDIELSCGEERARRLTALAREKGLGTVVSRHDFQKAPPQEEMVAVLLRMKALGADLPKLAVMPQSPEDVLALLGATLQASRQIGPVITMAMGDLGKLSRVCGGLTGSCLTFGAGENASAPGQLNAEDLRAILQDLDPRGDSERGM